MLRKKISGLTVNIDPATNTVHSIETERALRDGDFIEGVVRVVALPASPAQRIPFDLEAAKSGAPLVTQHGRKARFIAHVPETAFPFLILCEGDAFVSAEKNTDNLFMAPKPKRKMYVNIYGNRRAAVFDTEKEAREVYNYAPCDALAVAVPVEVEGQS